MKHYKKKLGLTLILLISLSSYIFLKNVPAAMPVLPDPVEVDQKHLLPDVEIIKTILSETIDLLVRETIN